MITAAGAEVWRVGFNRGDRVFWPLNDRFVAYHGPPQDWPETCRALMEAKGITDLVLYGDTRPIHAQAIASADPTRRRSR